MSALFSNGYPKSPAQVVGSYPNDWLLGFSFAGRTKPVGPHMRSQLLPSPLAGACQLVPALVRGVPPRSELATSC